jgi:hypothetical protein
VLLGRAHRIPVALEFGVSSHPVHVGRLLKARRWGW